jgi:uncharacterized membrane protein YdjX (TVP38/TMEM64 family)
MDNAQHDRAAARTDRSILRRLLPLAVLAILAAVVVYNGWHEYLTLQHVADNRDALHDLVTNRFALALLGYMAVYVAVVALSLPGGALLTITGGFLFGWLVAGLATVVAATAGATVIFLIARTSLGEILSARAGPWLDRLASGFRDNALSYLLFLRLVPAFPFWLVNLAPALLGVPLGTYVLGTAVGIIPGTFAFAFLGAGLDSIIAAQRDTYRACLDRGGADECSLSLDPASLLTPELIAAFVALGVVALIPALVRALRGGE